MYADDTAVYYTSKSVSEITHCLQEDLDCISYWLSANKLTLNAKKTKTMLFHTQYYTSASVLNLSVRNEALEQVFCFKYLGIWLDPRLNFNNHIDKLCSKSNTKTRCYFQGEKIS